MAETIEKPTPSQAEYDKLIFQLPQINKEIKNIILRNEQTINLSDQEISRNGIPTSLYTEAVQTRVKALQRQKQARQRRDGTTDFDIQNTAAENLFSPSSNTTNDYNSAKENFNNAKTHIEKYNIGPAKEALDKTISNLKAFDLDNSIATYQEILDSLRDPNSKYYQENALNQVNVEFNEDAIQNFIASLTIQRNLIQSVIKKIEKAINLQSKDVLKKVVLDQAGFIEDPKNPGNFVSNGTLDKDPWGIRFTIVDSLNNSQVVSSVSKKLDEQYKARNKAKGKSEESGDASTSQQKRDISLNNDILEDAELNQQKHWYMELLPAIKSNLPIQGATDVPGAQPGLNFRVEHSIVKHKVPGFSPIYQPMGVESIRCTIVGCFTGADGTDIWSPAEREKDRLAEKRTTIPLEFTGRGDSFESLTKNIGQIEGPVGIDGLVGLTRSYDAFQNAQEFYNMIIAPGKQVEVEINLKKNDLAKAGGSAGPFRNSESGNPNFKALVRKMDLYYVRADRCWYILDLEVTESGLIGNKCLNLTVDIDASTDLLERAAEAAEEDAENLDNLKGCLGRNIKAENPNVEEFKDESGNFDYLVDKRTGYAVLKRDGEVIETFTPEEFIQNLVFNADDGGITLDNRNLLTNLFIRAADKNINKFAATIMSKWKYPESKIITSSTVTNIGEIRKNKAFNVNGRFSAYYFDKNTNQFFRKKIGGGVDLDDTLSIPQFLEIVDDDQDFKEAELRKLFVELLNKAKAEGRDQIKYVNTKELSDINDKCYLDLIGNVQGQAGQTNTSDTGSFSTTTTKRGQSFNDPEQTEEEVSENATTEDVKKAVSEESNKIIKNISKNTDSNISGFSNQALNKAISNSWRDLIRGEDTSLITNELKNTLKEEGGIVKRRLWDKAEPLLDDSDSIYQNKNNFRVIFVKTRLPSFGISSFGFPTLKTKEGTTYIANKDTVVYSILELGKIGTTRKRTTNTKLAGFLTVEEMNELRAGNKVSRTAISNPSVTSSPSILKEE